MSNEYKKYTGNKESNFNITPVIEGSQLFYKVEAKENIEPVPNIDFGVG